VTGALAALLGADRGQERPVDCRSAGRLPGRCAGAPAGSLRPRRGSPVPMRARLRRPRGRPVRRRGSRSPCRRASRPRPRGLRKRRRPGPRGTSDVARSFSAAFPVPTQTREPRLLPASGRWRGVLRRFALEPLALGTQLLAKAALRALWRFLSHRLGSALRLGALPFARLGARRPPPPWPSCTSALDRIRNGPGPSACRPLLPTRPRQQGRLPGAVREPFEGSALFSAARARSAGSGASGLATPGRSDALSVAPKPDALLLPLSDWLRSSRAPPSSLPGAREGAPTPRRIGRVIRPPTRAAAKTPTSRSVVSRPGVPGPVAIPIRPSASVFRCRKTAQKKRPCRAKDISQPSPEGSARHRPTDRQERRQDQRVGGLAQEEADELLQPALEEGVAAPGDRRGDESDRREGQ